MSTNKRPVQDLGVPKPERPFHAGGKDQGDLATRKTELSNTGSIGYVPGHEGTGRGSSLRAGYVHEAPPTPTGYGELEAARRPMPREQPVSSTPAHMGTIVRHLDGSSRIVRERPGLVELMNSPHVHPDDRDDIRQEIADRDAINLHKFW